ncbi:Glycosyl transferases group 1 [Flavobacterium sp. 9R]|uniref:glycosyltransferase family protein n=1 Tax=Flavobacterium sp. 9R TaxID=2653143 RepID=UPI0012F30B3B|nr:glycosyltransferase [Flavobacterium sp. 9R]VXB63602.1 Glycosyl transferases group 1 [Flavobacterium sp. 9R]
MKILLIGEYSRLHNSLKEGLVALGHEVILVASGDAFKNFPSDYSFRAQIINSNWFFKKTRNLIYSLTRIEIEQIEHAIRFYLLLPKLDKFDHVQLINSDALETFPWVSRFLYRKLFQNVKSRSLLICGDETPVIEYLLKKELSYSILTPFFEDATLKNHFYYPLKYTKPSYRKTFEWLAQNCQSMTSSDMDYKIPMERMGFNAPLIPNPVNCEKIPFESISNLEPIVIFLGINRGSYIKKGIRYFEEALTEIEKIYGNKVTISVCENQPYETYISLYNKGHIVLDQIYAMDQGYNALEAMAKGKVVFTGASEAFTNYYGLNENVAIHALPDKDYLVQQLSYLIENPSKIKEIGKRARGFIEKEHHYVKIAKQYLAAWKL